MNQRVFQEQDLAKIKRAVMSAEAKSAVEIVPVFDAMSDEYNEASYMGALYGGMLTILALSIYSIFGEWEYLGVVTVSALIALGFAWGALIPFLFSPIKRMMVGRDKLNLRSRNKAYQHFLDHNVCQTKSRTGVLIHLSFFERAINIIGDEGINKLVNQATWDAMVADIKDHLLKGEKVLGIIHCIEKCGMIVSDAGLAREDDDSNELSDHLRSEQ